MSHNLLFAFLLLFLADKIQAQAENTDDAEDNSGRPWENPVQELQSVTSACALKIPGFEDIASKEQDAWQTCVDNIILTVTEKFPVLESRSDDNGQDEEKVNASVIYEIDKQLHMVICSDTNLYKSCWSGIVNAINKCEPGRGDVAGKLYFALYDDICREGGRITVENRKKAALEGALCERNYTINECILYRDNLHSNDLCVRFKSNVACDIGSVDKNCKNKVDKGLHAEIFERVEKILDCSTSSSSKAWNGNQSSSASFSLLLQTSQLILLLTTSMATYLYV